MLIFMDAVMPWFITAMMFLFAVLFVVHLFMDAKTPPPPRRPPPIDVRESGDMLGAILSLGFRASDAEGREIFLHICPNGHRWKATDLQHKVADCRCPECGELAAEATGKETP